MEYYWFRFSDNDYVIAGDEWDYSREGYVPTTIRPADYYILDNPQSMTWVPDINKSKQYFEQRRMKAEEAGITFGGHSFSTKRNDRVLFLDYVTAATADPAFTVDFKDAAGDWFVIDATQIHAIHNAVIGYIKDCSAREKALIAMLYANQITPDTAEQDWPSQERTA